MPASKAPRKPYRPKSAPGQIPVLLRYSATDERQLKLVPHMALAAIREGRAVEEDWHTLAVRVNWGTVLARFPEYQGVQPDFTVALDALRSLKARAEKTGRWIGTGDELRSIGEALALCDEMQDGTTRRDLKAALDQVFAENERMRNESARSV